MYLIGIDGRIRTLTSGFGDRYATINTTPIYLLPFIAEGLPTPSRRSARLVFTEGIYPSQLSTSFNESSTGSSTSHVPCAGLVPVTGLEPMTCRV